MVLRMMIRLNQIIEILKASIKKEKKIGVKKDVIADFVEQGQMSIEAVKTVIELM